MKKSSNGSINLDGLKRHLYERIHGTGQEINNDLPNGILTAIESRAWEHFLDHEGKPFENLRSWLEYSWPSGCDLGAGDNALTWDQLRLCCLRHGDLLDDKVQRKILAELDKAAPLGKVGGSGSNQYRKKSKRYNVTIARGNNRAYLAARLARDFPRIYKRYTQGKYNTVHAAAVAAGLVGSGHDPLQRLKTYWKKATAEQQIEFLSWVNEQKV